MSSMSGSNSRRTRLRTMRDVGVRRVFAPRLPFRGEVAPKIVPPAVEKRANEPVAPQPDAREPARAGAAHEPQQHGFRLIIERVAGRDGAGVEAVGGFCEELIARVARRDLDRTPARPRERADIDARNLNGKAEPVRECSAEVLVAVGLIAAQQMVDVDQAGDGDAQLRCGARAAATAARRSRIRRTPRPPRGRRARAAGPSGSCG